MSASARISVLRTMAAALTVASSACDSSRPPAPTTAASDRLTVSSPMMADAAASATISTKRGRVAPARGVAGAVAGRRVAQLENAQGAAEGAEESEAPAQQPEVAPGSMLVRTGQASLQVDTLESGIARVREVARRTGAVIANTSMEGGNQQTRAASLELRIPSERFDEAVNGLAPIGKLESVNVSVEDVGEEYVDVQARVANARRLEQRLVELLANRTGKLADVLTVERELARVREQIERYEGRMRYLRTRASISTLSIAIHEPLPLVAEHPGERPIRDAFIQAWRNLVGVTAGLIASLGVVIPLGIFVFALVFIARRWLPIRSLGLTAKARDA
jgi:acetolactate synthase regulatory subunit